MIVIRASVFNEKKEQTIAFSFKVRYQEKPRHKSSLEVIRTCTLYSLGGNTARR